MVKLFDSILMRLLSLGLVNTNFHIDRGLKIYKKLIQERNRYNANFTTNKLQIKYAYSFNYCLKLYFSYVDVFSWSKYKIGYFNSQRDAALFYISIFHCHFVLTLSFFYLRDTFRFLKSCFQKNDTDFSVDLLAFEYCRQDSFVEGIFHER